MKRGSKAGGKIGKLRRRAASAPKRSHNSPKTALRRRSATALETEIARLRRELREALEQQSSTSEVLQVISRSTSDLKAVLGSLLERAVRLCEADRGLIYRQDGDVYRPAASYGHTAEWIETVVEQNPIRRDRSSATGRAVLERRFVHIHDVLADPEYRWGHEHRGAKEMHRTILAVPMMREDTIIGVIVIRRVRVQPFNDKQIALLENFAAQAVIAIENTRLLNELRESLQQQTATADVLKVISRSTFDLPAVLNTLVESAVRLCDGYDAVILLREGGALTFGAHHGPIAMDFLKWPLTRNWTAGRAVLDKAPIHVHDLTAAGDEFPEGHAMALRLGHRTILSVPLLRDHEAIGSLTVRRSEVRPFTNKQIELVETFADQAVIAIENVRLFEAEQERTRELTESLEQQTATTEVLRVISNSPGDVQSVFHAMLENGVRACGAKFGVLFRYESGMFQPTAMLDVPPAFAEVLVRQGAFPPQPGQLFGRLCESKKIIQVEDRATEAHDSPSARYGGARSAIAVPMLKADELVGAFFIYRTEVQPFTDKQIELVQNFAAQAVIAIENARLLNELRQRTNDLSEALEQQTASAEVLKVISSSPGDLKPVFDSMLANALRICEARFGNLWLREGNQFRIVTDLGGSQEYHDQLFSEPLITPDPRSVIGQIAETGEMVQIEDISKAPTYGMKMRITTVEIGKGRTLVGVPMLKNDDVVGVIAIYRQEVRPFSEKQIELVKNFAAQAVIAIENARLLNELRQSLEQQTATADVLRVISASPGELEPVFEAVLENAVRICEAKFGMLTLVQGNEYRVASTYGASPEYIEFMRLRGPFQPEPGSILDRVARTRQVSHTADYAAEAVPGPSARFAGARSAVCVPMIKDDVLIGSIFIYRQEVRPFTDKQIELVENFAAQAVIAIENARLLSELRESLEQQTATSEVLQVISSSPGDLNPVFEAILDNAVRICRTHFGVLLLFEGGRMRVVAMKNAPHAFAEMRQRDPYIPLEKSILGSVVRTHKLAHVSDITIEQPYASSPLAKVGGARTALGVPMLKEDELVGAIVFFRQEVMPFSEKEIKLLQNLAAQAVIAIENARLLNELRESLQQQTATADVLKIISRSTFDLKAVLQTLVESVARLCEADMAAIRRPWGSAFLHVASHGSPTEYDEYMQNRPIEPGRGTVAGRVLLEGKPIHIADVQADPEYAMVGISQKTGFHTILGVPLLREESPIGVIILGRKSVRPFTNKQIELATTFADQAGIAIENVRLFDEIQDKSRQLEVASQHKSQFLANMSHELRTPLNAILGYTELMADGAYGEPSEKMLGILQRLEANGRHLLGLINDVLDLSKIEAGQLELELSDYSVQDIAQTVRSTLEPLAADKKLGFKVEVAPQLPAGRGDGRRLTQVLINLVGNAIKFTDTGEVAIKAEANNGSFHVSVRDTGPGISAADQAKLFQEFQQADNAITRKKGGTGLGLAISKRIIEMHGGRIWVESQPGQGSTFAFTLPVHVERQVEAT
jgi:GAF domain-containing protein